MSIFFVDEQPEAMLGNLHHHQEMGKQSPVTIIINDAETFAIFIYHSFSIKVL